MKASFLSVLVFSVLLFSVCFSIPTQINYQGVLKDSSGNAVTNHSLSMVFSIYSALTGGSSLWSETQTVSVEAGIYSVQLGSVTAIPSSVFDGSTRYLGIKIGTDDEMTPRLALVSVPYAYNSLTSESTGSIPDASVTSSKIVDGAVSSSKLSSTGVTAGTYGSATQVGKFTVDTAGRVSSVESVTITGGSSASPGGSDKNVQFNNSGTFAGDNKLSWDNLDKRLGVGTAEPGALLDVVDTDVAIGRIKGNATTDLWTYSSLQLMDGNKGIYWELMHRKAPANYFALQEYDGSNYNQRFIVQPGGNTGIGADPATGYQLNIGGNVKIGTAGASIEASTGKFYGDGSKLSGISVSNADTVDNIHASTTATANYLFPLDASARFNLTGAQILGYVLKASNSSTQGSAISGEASGPGGIGIRGEATDASTFNYGGLFISNGPEGWGAKGVSSGALGSGVYGDAQAISGVNYGVYGRTFSAAGYSGYFTGGLGVKVATGTLEAPNIVISSVNVGSGTALQIDASGGVLKSSSSRRYKENINPLADDFSLILNAQPKSYTYKSSGQKDIGYIAEDFDTAGLKDLVIYNNEGQPDALKYDKISVYLLEIIKQQQNRISSLESRLSALEKK